MATKKKKRVRKKSSSAGRPDALELFGHVGRLSEAMRKGGYAITGGAYAASSMDGCLQGHRVVVRVVDGIRIYAKGGADFATLALDGDAIVVRFRAPPGAFDEHAGVQHFYRAVEDRPGWLEYRRPATRDVAPDLESKIGSLLGAAVFGAASE